MRAVAGLPDRATLGLTQLSGVTLLANGKTSLSVWPNTTFTLSWSSSGADSCQVNETWGGGGRPLQGQETMPGFASGSRTYTITCANRFGSNSSSVTVSVKPPPSLNFYNRPTFPRSGQAFALYWNSGGASSCTASGAWNGSKPENGRQQMPGFSNGLRAYTLTCRNPAGSVTRSVVVLVPGNVAPPRFRPPHPAPPRLPAPPSPFSRRGATLGKGGAVNGRQTATFAITRITYRLAEQPIAARVTGDPDPANNGLHYLYADHLGGINAIQRQNGVLEQMRYYPFGAYRSGGRSPITDRAFTGQKENMELGLYYYNARYYLPGLGRFLSADTIVPDKENPQALNRYSYTANNPLKFVDASGHCWGFASGLRDTFYQTTCENLDMAVSIIQHPDASAWDKTRAGAYIGVEALAHTTVLAGIPVAAVGCLTGAGTAICAAGGTAITAASADGDITNEVAAVANSASSVAQSLSADGDPTNEVTTLYRFADGVNSLSSKVSTSTVSGLTKAELQALAEKHVMGTNNSPFISTLLDPAKGAMTTDPWLQGIIQNPNNSLYVLRVPNHLLYYPEWSLAQAETEVLVLADSLVPYVIGNLANPFAQ